MSPRISISLLAAQPDQRLLALARDGNERAFEALVHRYRRPLLRYCRRMRLSETRAEDVLQQSFLQAWLALSRGAEVRELRAWLYRIVHNVAVNSMRGTAESHGELTEAVQARAALAGESNLERRIAVREALGEVAELPQMQRAAIFLTAVDGQTHDEVADALGISHGALRGLLYRARATLRGAAAALTPSPLLGWASNGTGAAAPSAERLAELAAGGGAGFAGVLLKGAVVAVTAGALATGAGVVANHERESAGRPHGAVRAALLPAPATTHERLGAGSAASTDVLVDLRSTHRRHSGAARHGKRSDGERAGRGERHGHRGSRDGVVHRGREEPSPRNDDGVDGGDGRGPRASGGNEENAAGADDRGGSSAASGSTSGSAPGGSAGQVREQSSSGDRHSGSDGSHGVGGEAGQQAAAEIVQPAASEADHASGGQTSGEQTQGGGPGDGTGGSSDSGSSRSDG
jgi:RNA polymerase sigma factor (sigma-70 family)